MEDVTMRMGSLVVDHGDFNDLLLWTVISDVLFVILARRLN